MFYTQCVYNQTIKSTKSMSIHFQIQNKYLIYPNCKFTNFAKADNFQIQMSDTTSPYSSTQKFITIKGANTHNLKKVDVKIPKKKMVVITGVSGSGKSSLAFDTLFAEGQRRYIESLSSYARQFLGKLQKPDVEKIDGISPAIAIEQKVNSKNPRSTVGTSTEIYDYLKLLFARVGKTISPVSKKEVKKQSVTDVVDFFKELDKGKKTLWC